MEHAQAGQSTYVAHAYLSHRSPARPGTQNAYRTPEGVVGDIADKTLHWQSLVKAHHMGVLWGELVAKIRWISQWVALQLMAVKFYAGRASGNVISAIAGRGTLLRSQKREFLDIERQIAKAWRRGLSEIKPQEQASVMNCLVRSRKLHSFVEAKDLANEIIDLWEQQFVLILGLSLVGIPRAFGTEVVENGLLRESRRSETHSLIFVTS
jgi:hypothetical protein